MGTCFVVVVVVVLVLLCCASSPNEIERFGSLLYCYYIGFDLLFFCLPVIQLLVCKKLMQTKQLKTICAILCVWKKEIKKNRKEIKRRISDSDEEDFYSAHLPHKV